VSTGALRRFLPIARIWPVGRWPLAEAEQPRARHRHVSDHRRRGSSVSAGRFGYRYKGEILSESNDGEITGARLERPARSSYGRLELVDL
jgi:hypothetical protein